MFFKIRQLLKPFLGLFSNPNPQSKLQTIFRIVYQSIASLTYLLACKFGLIKINQKPQAINVLLLFSAEFSNRYFGIS
jgi:hypothetical protein